MVDLRRNKRACRIEQIIEAARRCFARSGFHATSVQSICSEAGMSSGNLYRYFSSKEALVEAMCAEDMQTLAANFEQASESGDFFAALWHIISRELLQRPPQDMAVWVETIAESTRNPDVARITLRTRQTVHDNIYKALEGARAKGNIPAHADIAMMAEYLCVYGDGLLLSRVRDPNADLTPAVRALVTSLTLMLSAAPSHNDNAPASAPSP